MADAVEVNDKIKRLIEELDEIGNRPNGPNKWDLKSLTEYRIKELMIAERCIDAFRNGMEFRNKEK